MEQCYQIYRSSSRNLYANLKSAFLRFILNPLVSLFFHHLRASAIVESRFCQMPCCHLPCALIIEEPVRSLLVLFGDGLRLLMPLKPGLVLFVKTPALTFQGFSGHERYFGDSRRCRIACPSQSCCIIQGHRRERMVAADSIQECCI